MKKNLQKRGRKIAKNLTRISSRARREGKQHIRANLLERISSFKQVRLLVLEWGLLVFIVIFLAITQAFWYVESYASFTFGHGGTYTEGTLGKVNSLNPLFATTNSEKTLSKLLFATLASPDYSGHTGPDLAESIKVDETGKIWSVKLRPGLTWSDGQPITNQDVLFTVNILQNNKVSTAYSSNLSGVQVAEQNGLINFTLPAPYANFASALNIPIIPVHILKDVPASALLEHSFSIQPVSSGAFTYNASQNVSTTGERVVYLNANPHYHRGAPLLDSFVVHAYPDREDIVAAIKSGAITATADLLPTDEEEVSSSTIYQKQTAVNNGTFLFLNTHSQIFAQKTLRKALQQGLDMRSLRATLGDEAALDYPLLPAQAHINNYPALPEYDPETAKQTIVAAKLSSDKVIKLATLSTGYLPALADNLKFQLENLGFKVSVETHDPGQNFITNIIRPRAYDILISEIELGATPDLLAYYHSSQASSTGLNLSNYNNALADDAILAARSASNPTLRTAKLEAFLRYWVDDAPAIGIYQANMSYYFNKKTRSFSEDNRLVYASDRFNDVSRWATIQTTKNRTP